MLVRSHCNRSTQDGYKSWSVRSPDCALFSSLLSGAGPVIGQLLDDVIPILTSCLSPDNDPEMRLQYVTIIIAERSIYVA